MALTPCMVHALRMNEGDSPSAELAKAFTLTILPFSRPEKLQLLTWFPHCPRHPNFYN